MSVVFSKKIIDIPSANKIIAFRVNIGNVGPLTGYNIEWPVDARSCKDTTGKGIFGISVNYNRDLYYLKYLPFLGIDDPVFYILAVDERDIIYKTPIDIAFSKCNIKYRLDLNGFLTVIKLNVKKHEFEKIKEALSYRVLYDNMKCDTPSTAYAKFKFADRIRTEFWAR